MKKYIILFIFHFVYIPLIFSQNWFAGGSISYQYNEQLREQNLTNTNAFAISPTIGYKLNKIDFGMNLIFEYSIEDVDNFERGPYENIIIDFGIGPFLRYQFFDINKLTLLGLLSTSYRYRERTVSGLEEFYNVLSLDIGPVIEYNIMEHLSLYGTIELFSCSYAWTDFKYLGHKNKYFQIGLSPFFSIFNVSLGFFILF